LPSASVSVSEAWSPSAACLTRARQYEKAQPYLRAQCWLSGALEHNDAPCVSGRAKRPQRYLESFGNANFARYSRRRMPSGQCPVMADCGRRRCHDQHLDGSGTRVADCREDGVLAAGHRIGRGCNVASTAIRPFPRTTQRSWQGSAIRSGGWLSRGAKGTVAPGRFGQGLRAGPDRAPHDKIRAIVYHRT